MRYLDSAVEPQKYRGNCPINSDVNCGIVMSKENKVTPFSSGTDYEVWEQSCCGRCSKAQQDPNIPATCEIEIALSTAFWEDGTIPKSIAKRMGLTWEEHWNPFKRRCGEIDLIE